MLQFENQSCLIRLTLEITTDSEGGPAIRVRRWCRAEMNDEWEEDGQEMTLWPDDPVRLMCDALIPVWSAQAKAQACMWT